MGPANRRTCWRSAPDVTFTGIKLDNETDPDLGASVLEGFQEALRHNPKVISVSLGYDLCPSRPRHRPAYQQ